MTPGDLLRRKVATLKRRRKSAPRSCIGPEDSAGRSCGGPCRAAARRRCRFDVLIGLRVKYEANTTEFNSSGRHPVLKARTNADLQHAEIHQELRQGQLFVIFGEPILT